MALKHRIRRRPRRECTQAQQSRYDLATRSFADRTTASVREGSFKPGMPLFSHLKTYSVLPLIRRNPPISPAAEKSKFCGAKEAAVLDVSVTPDQKRAF